MITMIILILIMIIKKLLIIIMIIKKAPQIIMIIKSCSHHHDHTKAAHIIMIIKKAAHIIPLCGSVIRSWADCLHLRMIARFLENIMINRIHNL